SSTTGMGGGASSSTTGMGGASTSTGGAGGASSSTGGASTASASTASSSTASSSSTSSSSTSSSSGGDAGTSGQWVLGYYVGYDIDAYPIASIDWTGLTHIIFSPMTVNGNLTLDLTFDDSNGTGMQDATTLAQG